MDDKLPAFFNEATPADLAELKELAYRLKQSSIAIKRVNAKLARAAGIAGPGKSKRAKARAKRKRKRKHRRRRNG